MSPPRPARLNIYPIIYELKVLRDPADNSRTFNSCQVENVAGVHFEEGWRGFEIPPNQWETDKSRMSGKDV